jgi:5-methylthioribose kinase
MAEFSFTPENLSWYLTEKGLVGDASGLGIRALGGGVSNVVLLIEGNGVRWVAKQSLGKLAVQDDWRSDRCRVFREAEAIRYLGSKLDPGSLPAVIHVDEDNYFFIMTAAPPGSSVWKQSLLSGNVEMPIARQAGRLLGRLINVCRSHSAASAVFEDRTVFDQLRMDPYYRTAAQRHPDVKRPLEKLIEDTWQVRAALVHGDYSPKNMLIRGERIFLIDFECVHWGDPSFDAGFLLNHLLLKAYHQPCYQRAYFAAAREFWASLAAELDASPLTDFEPRTLRHLGGLMLARIDGKSPVEYIQDDETKNRVRRTAKRILLEEPKRLEIALSMVLQGLA